MKPALYLSIILVITLSALAAHSMIGAVRDTNNASQASHTHTRAQEDTLRQLILLGNQP